MHIDTNGIKRNEDGSTHADEYDLTKTPPTKYEITSATCSFYQIKAWEARQAEKYTGDELAQFESMRHAWILKKVLSNRGAGESLELYAQAEKERAEMDNGQ